MRPLLLAAVLKLSKKEIGLLLSCICWSVRCLISGIPSGTLEGYYGRTAAKIAKGEITTVPQITQQMLNVLPDNPKFESAAATANVAQAHLARYYLRALQMQVDDDPEPQYVPNDGSEVTLEHILPENPGIEWKHVPPDVAKQNCNRLGNQVLLKGTVNSKLGNAGYPTKIEALKVAEFSLTRESAKYPEWDDKSISDRQKKLAELALKTWPINSK